MLWTKAYEKVKSWLMPVLEFIEALLDLIDLLD